MLGLKVRDLERVSSAFVSRNFPVGKNEKEKNLMDDLLRGHQTNHLFERLNGSRMN